MAACAQMLWFYDMPCAVSAGMTDRKMPDFKAGHEKSYTEVLASLAGALSGPCPNNQPIGKRLFLSGHGRRAYAIGMDQGI